MGWPCTKIPEIFKNSLGYTLEVVYERIFRGQNLRFLTDKYGFELCPAWQVNNDTIFLKFLNLNVTFKQMPCGNLKVYKIPEFLEQMEQAGVPAYVGGESDNGVEDLLEYLSIQIDEQETVS